MYAEDLRKRIPKLAPVVDDLFFVWRFFNPRLPDVQGDYVGITGLQTFFEKLGAVTGGIQVEPISVTPFGDELVVTHAKDRMVFEGMPIEIDAVVVWRILGGRIAEAWDGPVPMMFVSFPSLKDPEHDPGPSNRHTGEALVWADWSSVAGFADRDPEEAAIDPRVYRKFVWRGASLRRRSSLLLER